MRFGVRICFRRSPVTRKTILLPTRIDKFKFGLRRLSFWTFSGVFIGKNLEIRKFRKFIVSSVLYIHAIPLFLDKFHFTPTLRGVGEVGLVEQSVFGLKNGGTAMAHYVTLVRYTQQGISKIKDSPSRLDGAKKAAEAEGGKIHTWHLTMGQYDAVLISEFPSDEACAKFALSAGALGNISTETLKAFDEATYRNIIGSLR